MRVRGECVCVRAPYLPQLEPALLETLLDNIATLASVYHKPPETFVCTTRMGFDDGVKAMRRSAHRLARPGPAVRL
jgi:AP-1 complex subunit beta-1